MARLLSAPARPSCRSVARRGLLLLGALLAQLGCAKGANPGLQETRVPTTEATADPGERSSAAVAPTDAGERRSAAASPADTGDDGSPVAFRLLLGMELRRVGVRSSCVRSPKLVEAPRDASDSGKGGAVGGRLRELRESTLPGPNVGENVPKWYRPRCNYVSLVTSEPTSPGTRCASERKACERAFSDIAGQHPPERIEVAVDARGEPLAVKFVGGDDWSEPEELERSALCLLRMFPGFALAALDPCS